MKILKKITFGIVALVMCAQITNAGSMKGEFSGSGCIINYSALEDLNNNSLHTVNIRLDPLHFGANEKIVAFAYDLEIPNGCPVNPTLSIEDFELLDQFTDMDLIDIRFLSGGKQINLRENTGDLQILIQYNVSATTVLAGTKELRLQFKSAVGI